MTDTSADLVTKIDVLPDLDGLDSFDAAIDKAIAKVNQLDAAIKRVNNLKPASPYAPSGASAMPSATTTAAVAAITATGVNLISRTPLADTVRKEAQKVARAAVQGAGGGVAALLSPPGGGGLGLPPPPQGGWFAGRAGGLMDPRAGNPLSKYDTSAKSFSGEPLETKKKPVAEGVERATGGGFRFGMDNLLAGAGLTAGVVAGANAMADSMDTIQRQQAQLARLTQTTGSATDAFFALNAAASDMRSDSGSFISTYTNMATATEKLGYSQERTIKATQGLVGALQLGGGSEEAKSAALYQIGQAFSSDRFGGDEFRSFMEAIGTMAPKVAEAFGTDVKGLRAMSEAGKLTADTMFKAFEKMAANNADLLKKQGWTWGQVTTVMKNDWQSFLAQATIGGEWERFTDWAANTLIPIARSAEKEVAEFWSTLSDDSKSAILIGILGAVGAAFAALAIPVLAALWPFLAIGAAVWLVYETFVEWKHWMDGESGSIFEGLFGSFDEFERRYPSIVKGLKLLSELLGKSGGIAPESSVPSQSQLDDYQKDKPEKGLMQRFLEYNGNFNPMPGLEKFLGLFGGAPVPADVASKASGAAGSVITNSGNTTTHIHVDSAKEAAEAANNLSNPGEITDGVGGNIAESTGAI
ncbi:tape measure protein [Escherichia coli]|nr:tape measure protein [Escherichia coli]EGI4250274.1 tape measure protein [Escherichia coli]